MNNSHAIQAYHGPFNQWHHSRDIRKAELLERFSIEAEENEFFDLATQLQEKSEMLRNDVMDACFEC